eukprot:2502350-Rhodomonas_salina.4
MAVCGCELTANRPAHTAPETVFHAFGNGTRANAALSGGTSRYTMSPARYPRTLMGVVGNPSTRDPAQQAHTPSSLSTSASHHTQHHHSRRCGSGRRAPSVTLPWSSARSATASDSPVNA